MENIEKRDLTKTKNIPRVALAMSTYNGHKYLNEQIDSLLRQENVDLTMYIRDDGSSDDTIKILESYNSEKIHVIKGKNEGVGNSFMDCLYAIPRDYEYYCFADQDDIWLDDKIITAVKMIGKGEEPTLYGSNQLLVDAKGNKLKNRFTEAPDQRPLAVLNRNIVSGCTLVWNRQLNDILVAEDRKPSREFLYCRIHDVWVVMVASLVGNIMFDMEPHILYRQHENNVVGVRKDPLMKLVKEKIYDKSSRNRVSRTAHEINRRFGDYLHGETRDVILTITKYPKNKVTILRYPQTYAYSSKSKFVQTVMILFGMY